MYKITVAEDGVTIWEREYSSGMEALIEYSSFNDYGTAKYERLVTIEGEGNIKTKRFSPWTVAR